MDEPLRILDTSVIVRYLTGDDPAKQARARAVIESDRPVGITGVALLETAHVLRTAYQRDRVAIVDALVGLVMRDNVVGVGIDCRQAAAKLMLCRPSGTVSFGDALLSATAASSGIGEAYTFDEKLDRAGISAVLC